MRAKMQLLEVVTGHSQFLSHFSIPQAIPTQPVSDASSLNRREERLLSVAMLIAGALLAVAGGVSAATVPNMNGDYV